MIDTQRLLQKAQSYGLDISHCVQQLALYAEILVDYNQKVNLTAITDPEGIEDKHFIDSLLFACQPEVQGKFVDVGTGAGFPGVVAKLYKPELQLTLMEPTEKRVHFLKYLYKKLEIEAEFAKERAEEAARKTWREKFDVASARGVARLNMLSEYCLPLVKEGGFFIAMKAATAQEELEQAQPAIEKLGGMFVENRKMALPQGDERNLLVVKKISQTPPLYPRNGGKIAKVPLK